MKSKRQSIICELISEYEVETQEELVSLLEAKGMKVTQATVSRDIREMRLTKTVSESGITKYALPKEETEATSPMAKKRFSRVLQEGFISADTAGNLVVVRTMTGMANAVGAAIDSLKMPEIVGTIAGDDTLFLAVKTEKDAETVLKRVLSLT